MMLGVIIYIFAVIKVSTSYISRVRESIRFESYLKLKFPIGARKRRLIGFSLLRMSRVIRQISIAISGELIRAGGKRAYGIYVR